MFGHNWRSGNTIGLAYKVTAADNQRVGDCWMRGRLKDGDVILCTAHSGDCFNTYVLLSSYFNGVRAELGSEFGAYTLGEPVQWQPTAREYHLLLAGEHVNTETPSTRHPLNEELYPRK